MGLFVATADRFFTVDQSSAYEAAENPASLI
jgi:hypothetical protein